jgi:hypothetical protein
MFDNEIGMDIPDIVFSYGEDVKENVLQYLKNLGEKERIAYKIAYSHLGTSFNIIRSTGYVEWINEKNNEQNKK